MRNTITILFLTVMIISCTSCYKDNEEDLYENYLGNCDTTAITYDNTILQLFEASCDRCHDEANYAVSGNNYNLGGYANIVAFEKKYPGAIVGSLKHASGFDAMPKFSKKLDNCIINKTKAWIESGMPK